MEIKYIENGSVTSAKGFTANGICAGVKASNTTKKDLALIYCDKVCNSAAIFTKNLVKSDTIYVTKKHLENGACYAYRKFPTWKPVVNTAVISRLNLKTSILSIHLSEIQPFSPFSGWIG